MIHYLTLILGGADLSFRELVLMYDDEELIKPELQRKYVWTKEEASMFIDSILLGLPVPSIFLAKVVDQKLIIDGYQRLMTVYDYVKGIYSATGKIFKLSNSEAIHATWRGKAFSELSKEEQRRINSTTIHAIIFEQKHPANDSGMYKIFERINTSGRNLKPQEIRNCVYHGKLNDLLFKLNKNEHWRSLWGKVEEDSRMLDMEFILRFFMIENLIKQHLDIKQISLKKELNVFMADENNNTDEALECFENKFTKTVEMIYYSLGEIAFRNISLINNFSVAKFAKSIHPAIFDALMVACSMNLDSQYHCSSRKLTRENYISLLNNNEFVDCISIRTTNTDKIIKRIKLASTFLFEN